MFEWSTDIGHGKQQPMIMLSQTYWLTLKLLAGRTFLDSPGLTATTFSRVLKISLQKLTCLTCCTYGGT